MKFLIHDWGRLMPGFVLWDKLSPDSRNSLFTPESRTPPAVPIHKIQPVAEAMIEGGWLEKGGVDFCRMETPRGLALYSALRQMNRVRLFKGNDPHQDPYLDYRSLLLTAEEIFCFSRAEATHGHPEISSWMESFLEAEDTARWEAAITGSDKGPERLRNLRRALREPEQVPLFTEPGVAALARELVRIAKESPAPLPLVEASRFAEADPQAFQKAFHACIRYFLLFPGLDKTLRPIFWILPRIGSRIHRAAIPFPRPVEARPATNAWNLPSDAAVILAHAAQEPLAVKSTDGKLFAKTYERILRDLPPIDPLPGDFQQPEGAGRADRVIEWLLELQWLAAGRAGGKEFLRITNRGHAALNESPAERLMAFVKAIRKNISKSPTRQRYGMERRRYFEIFPLQVHVPPHFGMEYLDPSPWIAGAFAGLEPGKFYCLEEWLRYFTIEKPPERLLESRRAQWGHWSFCVETDAPRILREMLLRFLKEHVLPMGFAIPAIGPRGELCFAIGKNLSVLTEGKGQLSESNQETPSGEVIVQADFEIIFLGTNHGAFAGLLGFCERIGTMPGRVFKISRSSVLAAFEMGFDAEKILKALSKWSHKPVPENVRQQIFGWAASCRVVEFRPVLLLRTPDHETTLRIANDLGTKAEVIAEKALAVHSEKIDPQLVRKWKAKGIFLRRPSAAAKHGDDENID